MNEEKEQVQNEEVAEEVTEVVEEATEEKTKKKKKKMSKEAEELEKLTEEFNKYKEMHLRTLAEYDNFRKRSINEKAQVYGNAVSDSVNAILPVADNIERALAQENASAEDFKKGLEMISNQFNATFDKLGITSIGEVGEEFNPELHNAVAHIENEELGENVVASIFQKGYKLGDKVVRHAMVQVAN